ncbi:MAG: hypothetical protein AAGF23_00645 [Acidobacteriota bacterium]
MSGELATRVTVWLALIGYLAGPLAALVGRAHPDWQRAARVLYSVGLLFFLAHVALAFHVYYGWSHSVAYAQTAQETFEVTGRRSGVGLYLNYLFTVLWCLDVADWRRRGLDGFRRRPPWVDFALHGFFLFMAFNATVVFEAGPVRWAGGFAAVALLVVAAVAAGPRRRRRVPLR